MVGNKVQHDPNAMLTGRQKHKASQSSNDAVLLPGNDSSRGSIPSNSPEAENFLINPTVQVAENTGMSVVISIPKQQRVHCPKTPFEG